jgi:hypothetical protein
MSLYIAYHSFFLLVQKVWIASCGLLALSFSRITQDGVGFKAISVLTGCFMILFMIVGMGNWNQGLLLIFHHCSEIPFLCESHLN